MLVDILHTISFKQRELKGFVGTFEAQKNTGSLGNSPCHAKTRF